MMRKLFLLAMIMTLGLVLILGGCGEKSTPAAPTETEPTTSEPTTEPVTEPEPETVTPAPTQEVEVSEDVDGPAIDYGSRGILSDLKCEDGTLSAIITNAYLDEEQVVAVSKDGRQQKSNVRIQVNGMNIFDYVCDKETLAAGEHTYCSDLMGRLKVKLRVGDRPNEVAVWFDGDTDNRGTATVMCTEGSALTVEEAKALEVETRQ